MTDTNVTQSYGAVHKLRYTGGPLITRILGPQKIRVIGGVFKYYLLIKRAP